MKRSNLTWQLNNCFMCNNPYDQKPLIKEEDEKSQSGSPLCDFKRGFSLFCKILNDVHSCDSELLTKFAESYENVEIAKEVDLVMGARAKSGVFELPCCSLCFDTLVTILGLQKAIEESQASQVEHVKNLKEVLKLSSDSANDVSYTEEDFWATIRRQLVACLTPATSFSGGDNDDTNELPCLEDSDNDECPIPTPSSSIYASVYASKDPLDTNLPGPKVIKNLSVKSKEDRGEPLRKRIRRYDNIRQENERTSFKPRIAKSTVKPCSVHLEKIDLTHIDEVRVNLPVIRNEAFRAQVQEPHHDPTNKWNTIEEYVAVDDEPTTGIISQMSVIDACVAAVREPYTEKKKKETVTILEKFECRQCGHANKSTKRLHEHMKTHLPKVACVECGIMLGVGGVTAHMRRKHQVQKYQVQI